MPTDLKTDPRLLVSLAQAAKRQMTKDELRLQKISFVMGNMPKESTLTRKQVEDILDSAEGVAA